MSLAGVTSRMLARHGSMMTLRRRVGTSAAFTSVDRLGKRVAFNPDEIQGALQQGDCRVTIGPDTGALGEVRRNDIVVDDGQEWLVMGCSKIKAGAQLDGYRLWVRGGK